MSDEFTELVQRDSLAQLTQILAAEEQNLSQVERRLYNNIHAKYKVLREASDALIQIHEYLTNTEKNCKAVIEKMGQLETSKLTVSCPDFDELAASLKDSLIRSLQTIWFEPPMDPQRYRFMTDSPKQLKLAKKVEFDASLWVKTAEDLARSFTKTDRPNINAALLEATHNIRFDEHALSGSSMNNFTHLVKRLDDHSDLIMNIIHGYTSYADTKYIQPLKKCCDTKTSAIKLSPCGSLILFSLVSLRIVLDLQKIHSALPDRLADYFGQHINAYSDRILARELLTAISPPEQVLTAAALKWYLKVTEYIKKDFPVIEIVYSRTCAHTVCNIIYRLFKEVALVVLPGLLDISNDLERRSQMSDASSQVFQLQRLLLEACSSNANHRCLVGDALYALVKLIWIGFLYFIDPNLDVTAMVAEELTRSNDDSNVLIRRSEESFDDCATLAQNMTEFLSEFRDHMNVASINLDELSYRDRAALIDTAKELIKLHDNVARESLSFKLQNWGCKNLSARFNSLLESQQTILSDSLTVKIAEYFTEAFCKGISKNEVQSQIIEPIVGLISQINYFCARVDVFEGQTSNLDKTRSSSGAELLAHLVQATRGAKISSLRVESRVRGNDDLKMIAHKQCPKNWREKIILEAFLKAIRKLNEDELVAQSLTASTKVLFIKSVVTLYDYVVPANDSQKTAYSKDNLECIAYLSGMLSTICAPNATADEIENLLIECSGVL